MQAQITKAVLSQALLFGIKDALEACKLVTSSCRPLSSARCETDAFLLLSTDTIASLVALSKTRGSAIGLQQI